MTESDLSMNTHQTSPCRILYVDANADMRRLMLRLLESAGHACMSAANDDEALGRITDAPEAFDLVIAAHHAPCVDGLALSQKLRAKSFQGRVMIYSMDFDNFDEADCIAHGVDAVLAKSSPGLLKKVAALCRR